MLTAVTKRWMVVLGLAVGCTATIWYRVGSTDEATVSNAAPTEAVPAVNTEASTAPTSTAPTMTAAVTPRANHVPTMDDLQAAFADDTSNSVLIAGLDAKDPVVIAEAANALVGRGALDAIPALLEADIIGRPAAAPSLIYALGKLGASASDYDHDRVVDRLLALLAQEKKRGAQESGGNLLQIYEALGDTGDDRAIAALEIELADASVKTAPKVVIVQALVTLGARQSKPVLERLASSIVTMPSDDDFEMAVRRDLLTAIREALIQLS